MIRVNPEHIPLIRAVLDAIRKEMDRLYWNKYQKVMDSPFDNTGEAYKNETFSVSAYDWDDDSEPNFTYKGFEVYWYKHSNRCVCAWCDCHITTKYLSKMLNDCIESLRKDFGEDDDI